LHIGEQARFVIGELFVTADCVNAHRVVEITGHEVHGVVSFPMIPNKVKLVRMRGRFTLVIY